MLLGSGRAAFLAFLRNLTPQILFLTLAFILGSKLELDKLVFTWQGVKNALPFSVCLILFLLAAVASILEFLEAGIKATGKFKIFSRRIENIKMKPATRSFVFLKAACKYSRSSFVQIFIVFLIVEAALVMVFVQSIILAAGSPLTQ